MTATERAKRSDALYYETVSVTRRVLCDMVVHREADLEDARAENAKLRELAERTWKSAERLCQAFDGPCRDDGMTIDKPCPMGERDEECVYGQLQRELRECGVEVDE